jgi:hypothetical protein
MKFILFLPFLACNIVFAQYPQMLSNKADYDIEVSLNTNTKILTGKETITYTNNTNFATSELQFHMYLNAFKDANSTFMKESGGQLRGDRIDKTNKKNWGNSTIRSIKIANGDNLLPSLKYIQTDDLNISDKTVFSVKLPKPLLSKETIKIEINFIAQLPKIFARTGWAEGEYFMIGQWFPKIGVLENAADNTSKWNCHQFHAHTEFFSDFGNYNVNITLPAKFILGASGIKKQEILNKNKTKTHTYLATNVHDFAFTASPYYKVLTQKHKNITLTALMQPEHENQAERYFMAAKRSIDFLAKNVGHYPHNTLTMVDPPIAGSGSGGMEYPTLITCGSYWGLGNWVRMAEVVTIHEFTHQYFQGILASNEFEESWLDEGFTQYIEGRIMDEIYSDGSQFNVFGFTMNDMASSRMGYVSMDNPRISESYRKAWQYPAGTYGVLTYQKTATWLKTLEGLLGKDNMTLVLKTYFEKYKFKHPKTQDFIGVVNDIAKQKTTFNDMNWFFDQVLFNAPVCDYAIENVINTKTEKEISSSFTVQRLDDMKIPTEIKVVFADNKTQTFVWDGLATSKDYKFSKNIKSVQLDPNQKNWMDVNLINNSKSVVEPKTFAAKFSIKIMFWVQRLFLFLG